MKQRPFCCGICATCFGLKSDLKRHVTAVHKKELNNGMVIDETVVVLPPAGTVLLNGRIRKVENADDAIKARVQAEERGKNPRRAANGTIIPLYGIGSVEKSNGSSAIDQSNSDADRSAKNRRTKGEG